MFFRLLYSASISSVVYFTLVLTISASIVLSGCSKVSTDSACCGYIAGTVTDSLTGSPIDSAWVDVDTILPPNAYSNNDGKYVISAPSIPAEMFLFCGKIGYETKKSPSIITNPRDTVIVNFQLKAGIIK